LTVEEEIKVLALAGHLGLSCMYDASQDSYSNWRTKVLTFAQQVENNALDRFINNPAVIRQIVDSSALSSMPAGFKQKERQHETIRQNNND
jgi:hypothetical protein